MGLPRPHPPPGAGALYPIPEGPATQLGSRGGEPALPSCSCLLCGTHVFYFFFQKTLDDLQAEEDKVNHLTKSNSKLSTQIHEVTPRRRAQLYSTTARASS